MQNLHEHKDDPTQQAQSLANWVAEKLGLTIVHPGVNALGNLQLDFVAHPEGAATLNKPCFQYYTNAPDHENDFLGLVNVTQMHKCFSYCLRTKKQGDM